VGHGVCGLVLVGAEPFFVDVGLSIGVHEGCHGYSFGSFNDYVCDSVGLVDQQVHACGFGFTEALYQYLPFFLLLLVLVI
jgi:hypothetical protein